MPAQSSLSLLRSDETQWRKILVIAERDLFVDGILRILESGRDAVDVSCVTPEQASVIACSDECPNLLLLFAKSTIEPVEDFIRKMRAGFPGARLLVFGQAMPDDCLYRMVKAGAHGYINEKMTGERMAEALAVVQNGGYWVERRIMERFITGTSLKDGVHDRVNELNQRLTRRESEVLGLVLMGLSTGEIAERIFLSHQGVKAHLTTLFRKFAVRNRSQLILRAMDESSPVEDMSVLIQQGLKAARESA